MALIIEFRILINAQCMKNQSVVHNVDSIEYKVSTRVDTFCHIQLSYPGPGVTLTQAFYLQSANMRARKTFFPRALSFFPLALFF